MPCPHPILLGHQWVLRVSLQTPQRVLTIKTCIMNVTVAESMHVKQFSKYKGHLDPTTTLVSARGFCLSLLQAFFVFSSCCIVPFQHGHRLWCRRNSSQLHDLDDLILPYEGPPLPPLPALEDEEHIAPGPGTPSTPSATFWSGWRLLEPGWSISAAISLRASRKRSPATR